MADVIREGGLVCSEEELTDDDAQIPFVSTTHTICLYECLYRLWRGKNDITSFHRDHIECLYVYAYKTIFRIKEGVLSCV